MADSAKAKAIAGIKARSIAKYGKGRMQRSANLEATYQRTVGHPKRQGLIDKAKRAAPAKQVNVGAHRPKPAARVMPRKPVVTTQPMKRPNVGAHQPRPAPTPKRPQGRLVTDPAQRQPGVRPAKPTGQTRPPKQFVGGGRPMPYHPAPTAGSGKAQMGNVPVYRSNPVSPTKVGPPQRTPPGAAGQGNRGIQPSQASLDAGFRGASRAPMAGRKPPASRPVRPKRAS